MFTYERRHHGDPCGMRRDMGQMHRDDDPGAGSHPQHVLGRQQGRDAEARGLVLTDNVVTTCEKMLFGTVCPVTIHAVNTNLRPLSYTSCLLGLYFDL